MIYSKERRSPELVLRRSQNLMKVVRKKKKLLLERKETLSKTWQ